MIRDMIYSVHIPPKNAEKKQPVKVVMFYRFCAGEFVGKARLGVRIVNPDGSTNGIEAEQLLEFPGDYHMLTLAGEFYLVLTDPGRHFVDLFLDGRQVARIPLLVQLGFPPLAPMKTRKDLH